MSRIETYIEPMTPEIAKIIEKERPDAADHGRPTALKPALSLRPAWACSKNSA